MREQAATPADSADAATRLADSIRNLTAGVTRVKSVEADIARDGKIVSAALRPLIDRSGPVRVGFRRWYGPSGVDSQALSRQTSKTKRVVALSDLPDCRPKPTINDWAQFAQDLPRIVKKLGVELPGTKGAPQGVASLRKVAAALNLEELGD